MLLVALALSVALAESPGVMPAGTRAARAGAGLTTFRDLGFGSGAIAGDRVVQPHVDLYGAWAPAPRLQVSGSVPVVASWVTDGDAPLPCPDGLPTEGHCEGFGTVGAARIDARYGLLAAQRGTLTLGVAAGSDRWNAARRGQYNAQGTGRSHLEALVIAGTRADPGAWTLDGVLLTAFGYSLAPSVTSAAGGVRVPGPGDHVRASLELHARPPGPVTLLVGAHALQRLSGVELDAAWIEDWWRASLDRWNVLMARQVTCSAGIGFEVAADRRIELQVQRAVAVQRAFQDTTDVSVGWHQTFAP